MSMDPQIGKINTVVVKFTVNLVIMESQSLLTSYNVLLCIWCQRFHFFHLFTPVVRLIMMWLLCHILQEKIPWQRSFSWIMVMVNPENPPILESYHGSMPVYLPREFCVHYLRYVKGILLIKLNEINCLISGKTYIRLSFRSVNSQRSGGLLFLVCAFGLQLWPSSILLN